MAVQAGIFQNISTIGGEKGRVPLGGSPLQPGGEAGTLPLVEFQIVKVFQRVPVGTVVDIYASRLLHFGKGIQSYLTLKVIGCHTDVSFSFIIDYPYVRFKIILHNALI